MHWIVILLLLIAPPALAGTATGVTFSGSGIGTASGGGDWASTFGPCTAGTDCYCDRVQGNGPLTTSDPLYNANTLFCADFDNDGFYATTPSDPGTSGENWTAADVAGNRGGASYWYKTYGYGPAGTWLSGEPDSGTPTYGAACGFARCTGSLEWDPADRWNANTNDPEPMIDIIFDSADFQDEHPSSSIPTIPGSGGYSFGGNALLGLRVARGTPGSDINNGSILSDKDLIPGGNHDQLGATMALGYESNVLTSGVLNGSYSWKHDEVYGSEHTVSPDGLMLFRSVSYSTALAHSPPLNTAPFHGFSFHNASWNCSTALASATVTYGYAFCDDGNDLIWHAVDDASANGFSFTGDFDLTELHCVQIYWDFRNIASVTAKYVFDGTIVILITGMDFTNSDFDAASGTDGYKNFAINNYNNGASGVVGSPPLTASSRRYMDNWTITDGTPIACSKAGFPTSYDAGF